MIYSIPIEPLEERYSTQWATWWAEGFVQAGEQVTTVPGTVLTQKVETGSFLDCHGTVYWKSAQLMHLAQLLQKKVIKDGDTLFFHDLWFPGIEGLAYIRDISGIQFKIAGYLHAGTYDPADLLHQVNMQRWARGFEQSVLQLADHIFVGSEYHVSLLRSTFPNVPLTGKVHSIGYPVHGDSFVSREKKRVRRVVFPHRLDKEKQPGLFDKLAKHFEGSGVEFVKTKKVCKSKQQYYDMLNTSTVAVSFAQQETFGIAMVEAALCGCIPIAPNGLSYTSTMPRPWRFNTFQECCALVEEALTSSGPYRYQFKQQYSLKTIVDKVLKVIT